MGDHIFFWIGLAFLLTHEMDAIRAHEWRIFPLTAWLDEAAGYRVFTLAHVPPYAWLLAQIARPQGVSSGLRIGLDIFSIIHVALHLLFLRHPKNEFTGWFSWLLILGAGAAGALDLVVGG